MPLRKQRIIAMFPLPVLLMLSPTLIAMPWTKRLEASCKEAAKKIRKNAKSVTQEKLTEAVVEKIICAEVGKLDKTLTKEVSKQTKKALDTRKKEIEKEIEKKDPGSPQALDLTNLRDQILEAKKERKALDSGKPAKLPKPKGGGISVPIKIKVLTRDNVELEVSGFIGIDLFQIVKGKLPITYGVIGISGRF